MAHTQWFTRQGGVAAIFVLLIAFLCLTPPRAAGQYPSGLQSDGTVVNHTAGHKGISGITDDSLTRTDNTPQLSAKQKQYILHANFEKSKSDAAELATLAKELREELKKPNANGLSLEALARIDKIQKLAKRIRDETKGF
jgi:hypothetical protein